MARISHEQYLARNTNLLFSNINKVGVVSRPCEHWGLYDVHRLCLTGSECESFRGRNLLSLHMKCTQARAGGFSTAGITWITVFIHAYVRTSTLGVTTLGKLVRMGIVFFECLKITSYPHFGALIGPAVNESVWR